jgi:hypothetical protein
MKHSTPQAGEDNIAVLDERKMNRSRIAGGETEHRFLLNNGLRGRYDETFVGIGFPGWSKCAVALVKIDHSFRRATLHHVAMKVTEKQTLAVPCPTCGAKPGEKCELSTGQPRTDPHRDRRLEASDK